VGEKMRPKSELPEKLSGSNQNASKNIDKKPDQKPAPQFGDFKRSNKNFKKSSGRKDSRLSLFLGFLLVACVLGIAVRIYFAPSRITPWLKEKIARAVPQGGIDFKFAELQLSRGVLPSLALEIHDIEIRLKNPCAENMPPIRIQNAILPVDVYRLFKGELALSEIGVHKIEVDIEDFQQNCAKPDSALVSSRPAAAHGSAESPAPVAAASQPLGGLAPSMHLKFWDETKVAQVAKLVAGIEFDEIKFYFDHHQKYFILKDFNLRQEAVGEYKLSSEFQWPQEFASGVVLPVASVHAQLNEQKIQLEISTQVSEGSVQLHSVLTPAPHSPLVEANIVVRQLPVSAFTNYLSRANLLPANAQPRFVWLSLAGELKGRLDELKQLPIEMKDILLDGEFGQATVAHLVRNSDSSLSSFNVELNRINVQKALELFSVKGPDGVLSHFGAFTGELNFKSSKNFRLKGDLENASLRFSRHGSRIDQKINKLNINLELEDGHWNGQISDVDLENGDFDGDIQLRFDRAFDQGEISLAIENIELDPKVQKTMFSGLISEMKISGKLFVSKFFIDAWQGESEIKSFESADFNFKFAKLDSQFKSHQLNIQAKVTEGEYRYSPKLRNWIKQIFLDFEDQKDHFIFTNFKADLTQIENQWVWSRLKASLLDGQVQVSSRGELDDHDQVHADLNFDFPKAKKCTWKWDGPIDEPVFRASSSNLKFLIDKNADFKSLGLNLSH
jgi:hypothetical protein